MYNLSIQQIFNKKFIRHIPQEVWSGKKSCIYHLRVFGSKAHVYVQEERKTKLDDKSEMSIFIGYNNNYKGYKLYNPNNRNIAIS